jgi:hypothetical protein
VTRWATLLVGFLVFGSFPLTGPAQAQSGDGWIVLFDGTSLDHWQGDGNANFAIDDGSIVAKDKKDPKITAFLISKEKYKDFQIYAEFWASNDANSGIFIRCEDPKKPGAKTCYECNIFDTRPDPTYGTGAIVYHAEVNPMPKAGGKWSTIEIAAKGRDLSLSAAAYTLKDQLRCIRRGRGQVPQGRYQAVVTGRPRTRDVARLAAMVSLWPHVASASLGACTRSR